MPIDTTDYTNNAPYLQRDEILEVVTIDGWYYTELKKKAEKFRTLKKLVSELLELQSFPMQPTSDEKVRENELKIEILKLL